MIRRDLDNEAAVLIGLRSNMPPLNRTIELFQTHALDNPIDKRSRDGNSGNT